MAAALDDLQQRLPEREEGDGAGHQQGEAAGKDKHEVQQAHRVGVRCTVIGETGRDTFGGTKSNFVLAVLNWRCLLDF